MQQEKQFLLDLKKHFKLNIYEVKIWTSLLTRELHQQESLLTFQGFQEADAMMFLNLWRKKDLS